MSSSWKLFWDAAKETPKLYFAPLNAMFVATREVQKEMIKTQSKTLRAKTFDRAPSKGPTPKRPVRAK
jgi:hypothetical protein